MAVRYIGSSRDDFYAQGELGVVFAIIHVLDDFGRPYR